MLDDDAPQEADMLAVRSRFVRGRNALFAEADFGPIFRDYYLHRRDHRLEVDGEADAMLKTALAAFGLHCVSRPRNDVLAWTVNFQEPLLNLFLAGDTGTGDIIGRAYRENVKKADENAFYQDLARPGRQTHRSVVGFHGGDVLRAVENFYQFSEQRPARFFQLEPDRFAIVAAHPDYDEAWFSGIEVEQARALGATEEVVDLETRFLRWRCGCNQTRILQVLAPVFRQDAEGLFLGEELIEVNCPRCAGKYRVTREAMEAYVAEHG